MGFRILVVNTHSKLSYKNNYLYFKSEEKTEPIHISEIDMLFLETTDISLTTMLMAKLMQQNVCIIFCDEKRLPSAQLMPFYSRFDSALTIKKQMVWNDDDKALATYELLKQKIKNQSALLKTNKFIEKSLSIEELLKTLEPYDPNNREGHAARIFFNTLYGNDFNRESICNINAALDYGYTLLMSIFAREIVKCGCLTQLGINHSNQFNPFNLASDLMEPFRIVVDEIVYKNKRVEFEALKWKLFNIFETTYPFNGSNMYLNNIVSTYVKAYISYLNNECDELPIFNYPTLHMVEKE